MERMKLMFVWGVIYYAAFTLLLFSIFAAWGAAAEVEADKTSYHDEPSGSWSHSQHRSIKWRKPNVPRGPGSASTMAPTMSGRVFCTSCMNVNSPLYGVEAGLLCPHRPPATGGRRGGGPGMRTTTMVQVSSAVTDADGWFHLTANDSYVHIMNRCAVTISKSSDSNCDIQPPTGPSVPVPVSFSTSSSSESSDGDDDESSLPYYSLGSFSFRPASCSVHKTNAAEVGKRRTLLQDGEEPLGKEDPEKTRNHKCTRSPISGSDPHGSKAEETPAMVEPVP